MIGFDDIPLAAMVTPPLTTVAAPTVLAGQAAVEGLLDRLEHKHKRRPHVGEIRTLPATLVVRGSTAAPPRLHRGSGAGAHRQVPTTCLTKEL